LLGVDVETIAENLMGVINQRLVRRICPMCVTAVTPTEEQRAWLQLESDQSLYEGMGCEHCRETGYLGRIPVYEMLLPDRDVADGIAVDISRAELRRVADASGMRPIHTLARRRVVDGHTTLAEIHRAVGEGVS